MPRWKTDVAPICVIFAAAFLVGILLGYIGGHSLINPIQAFVSHSASSVFVTAAAEHSLVAEFLAVFANNAIWVTTVSLGALAFKRIGYHFLFVVTAYMGGLIGIVAGIGIVVLGVAPTIAALAPHGIFEIPAAILGIAIGHYGTRMIRSGANTKGVAITNAKLILMFCIPTLILAAAIETYLTPAIMAMVM